MIDEDIRFFKKHVTYGTGQPSYPKGINETSPFAALSKQTTTHFGASSQFDSRINSIGLQSTFTRQLSPGIMAGLAGVDVRGGLQKIKDTQADVLEELREEHEKIKKISVAPSNKTSRVSNESSSNQQSSSSIREESRASLRAQRQPTSLTIQKRFESELLLKSKRISELQSTQQELQQTIQQLRVDIRKREQAGTIPNARLKQLQTEYSNKLAKETTYFRAETQRFIAENTQLKKDLVARGFEVEELRRALRQSEDQLRFRQEDYKRNMRSIEQTMSSKESHYRRIITELQSEEKQVLVAPPAQTSFLRDYETFRREELNKLESGPKRNQTDFGNDELSLFRRLLSEQHNKAKQKQFELDRSIKLKLSQIKELEKTLAAARQKELDLEAQLVQREQTIKRQAQRQTGSRVAERQQQLNRKFADREEFWAKKLADAQQQWTRALSQALEREKKSNFEQFQRTFEQLGKHKDSELETLRSHRQSVQRKYKQIESEHQQSLRKLGQEIDQYRNEANKERRRAQQYAESLQTAKKDENEARMKSEMLQREIQQIRAFFDKQQQSSKSSSQESEKLKYQMGHLQSELNELRSQNSRSQTQVSEIKAKNTQLQAALAENNRYVIELENALKPLQPKRPNIMQQSETQHWKAREQQLVDRIDDLQRQLQQSRRESSERVNYQVNEEKITRLQAEWKRKEEDLQETIRTLRTRLQGNHENGEKNRLQLDELKQYIVDAVQSPAQQLRHKQLEFQRETERLKIEHNQKQQNLRRQYRLEIEQLTRRLRQAEGERNSLQNQLEVARTQEIHFEDTITRLKQEISRKDEIRREEKMSFESEISRLLFEQEGWKRKYQTELPKLTRSGQELLRSLNQKYERDVAGLKVVNQKLMQQAADILHLSNQNQQLVIANRQLQAMVKDKSQAVDHLWSVKQAEYENISAQIKRVRAIQYV